MSFERLSGCARQSLVAAAEQARRLGLGEVHSDHLLAGILSDRDSIGACALRDLAVPPPLPEGKGRSSEADGVAFDQEIKELLDAAASAAGARRPVTTGDLLLAMVKRPQTRGGWQLAALGVGAGELEQRVRAQGDQEDDDRHQPLDPRPWMVTVGPPDDPAYEGPVWMPPDED